MKPLSDAEIDTLKSMIRNHGTTEVLAGMQMAICEISDAIQEVLSTTQIPDSIKMLSSRTYERLHDIISSAISETHRIDVNLHGPVEATDA